MTDTDTDNYDVVWHGGMRLHPWSHTKGELLSTAARASSNGPRVSLVWLKTQKLEDFDALDALYWARR